MKINKQNIKKSIKEFLPDRVIELIWILRGIPPYFNAIYKDRKTVYHPLSFYDDEETVNLIVNEHKSLCRFGDGELAWMCGANLDSFQKSSPKLAKALLDAYESTDEKLLIGLPIGIQDSRKCKLAVKMHWRVIKADFYKKLNELPKIERIYANASITRPYIDYKDRKYSERQFNNLKRIWNGRNILIVEGEKTKLGIGNDLFNNSNSIRRIICPAENAFEKISLIEEAIRIHARKTDLILVALGPTATVLAAKLCGENFQVIDIGHVDIEYMWFLKYSILRDPIDGKYVNESGVKDTSSKYDNDENYLSTIIQKVF